MDVVNTGERQWLGALDHRTGGVEFKTLFEGEEGLPDNYLFSVVRVRDSYQAPTHRHNFDQVRYILEGEFCFGSQTQTSGQVGYFPEGVEYTQRAEGYSLHLLLQTSNANRARYISRRELHVAVDDLKASGRFVDGVFIDRANRRQDGYEAAWEQVTGEPIAYFEPRYSQPVIMDPARFNFLDEAPGVQVKRLGTFTERELSIGIVRMAPGARWVVQGAAWGRSLFYVTSGKGHVQEEIIEPGFGVRIQPEDCVCFSAELETDLIFIQLPQK